MKFFRFKSVRVISFAILLAVVGIGASGYVFLTKKNSVSADGGVSGKIWFPADFGSPVSTYTVGVTPISPFGFPGQPSFTTADSSGRFSFSNLPPAIAYMVGMGGCYQKPTGGVGHTFYVPKANDPNRPASAGPYDLIARRQPLISGTATLEGGTTLINNPVKDIEVDIWTRSIGGGTWSKSKTLVTDVSGKFYYGCPDKLSEYKLSFRNHGSVAGEYGPFKVSDWDVTINFKLPKETIVRCEGQNDFEITNTWQQMPTRETVTNSLPNEKVNIKPFDIHLIYDYPEWKRFIDLGLTDFKKAYPTYPTVNRREYNDGGITRYYITWEEVFGYCRFRGMNIISQAYAEYYRQNLASGKCKLIQSPTNATAMPKWSFPIWLADGYNMTFTAQNGKPTARMIRISKDYPFSNTFGKDAVGQPIRFRVKQENSGNVITDFQWDLPNSITYDNIATKPVVCIRGGVNFTPSF